MYRSNLKSLIPGMVPFALALIMSGCASTGSGPTASGPMASESTASESTASAPAVTASSGHADYCDRHSGGTECLKKTRLPQNWRKIAAEVQAEVNKMPYKTDDVRYGRAEFWERTNEQGGDCEDYALEKLRRLVEAGFPIERLRLATALVAPLGAFTRANRNHAVLVIDAPDDQYILDNRIPNVVSIPVLIGNMYTLLQIQRVGGSRQWVAWKFS
jgi:predicted transglutaminase-like cysteine proteinase